MRRDFDLIRSILRQAEAAPGGTPMVTLVVDGDIPSQVIAEHIVLLIEAGFIEGQVVDCDSPAFVITRLTWPGHDFLDAMKDEGIWKKARETILKPVGGVAFDVLKEWLKVEARKQLGLP